MTRTPVISSNIAAIGYNPANEELEVEFKGSGGVYLYLDVSERDHQTLMAAASVGKHLNEHIKGKRPVIKLEADEKPAPQQTGPNAFLVSTIETIVQSMDGHGSTLYRTDLKLADGRHLCVVLGLGDVGAFVSQEARGWANGTEKAFYPEPRA